MKVVIDTNIYFSSLLKKESTFGELLLGIDENTKFYAPQFLLDEIVKHKNKIIKISGLEEVEISELQFYLNSKINFINEQLIVSKNWMKAYEILKDVDEKDIPFLALSFQLDAKFWTGDKKIISAINNYNKDIIIDTKGIKLLQNK